MQLLKDTDMARKFAVTRQTIWRWTHNIPGFPAPFKIGEKTIRWDAAAVDAYIESTKTKPQGGDE